MVDTVHVKGLSEVQRFLDQLPPKIERNVLRGGLRAGARVIMAEAKARVPMRTGKLQASLRISVRARGGTVTASVKAGGRTRRGDAFYAHMVEFGTRPHIIAAGGSGSAAKRLNRAERRFGLVIGGRFVGPLVRHPGAKPRPFMRPALDGKAHEAVVASARYMRERLATKEGLNRASEVALSGDGE